jgi:hypothetical protein
LPLLGNAQSLEGFEQRIEELEAQINGVVGGAAERGTARRFPSSGMGYVKRPKDHEVVSGEINHFTVVDDGFRHFPK